MNLSCGFFKCASICALASALTTLAIHHLPRFWAGTDTGMQGILTYFEWVGNYFQPLARSLIGYWLWGLSKSAETA